MSMDVIEEFWGIALAATEKVDETYNAPDVIPYGVRVLELIECHPEEKGRFVEAFVQSFTGSPKCEEALIEFCMHALRWPEAKERFETLSRRAIQENDWNSVNPLQHILEAFEDDWEDATDFYAEYFHGNNT